MGATPCDSGGVIHQMAPERPVPLGTSDAPAVAPGLLAAAAAVRGAAVAVSGLIFTAALALVAWSITPASGPEASAAMRAGVSAFALANLMPITVDGTSLTLPPLMLTGLIVALLISVARHGRYRPNGRSQETLAVLVTAGTYGLVVASTTRGLGAPDAIPAGSVWTAPALAVCAVAVGTLGRGSAWQLWWRTSAPPWAQSALRGGIVGIAALIAGGALALAVALITNFGSAVAVAAMATPGWVDGLGMATLGVLYLPNAVVAASGYVTGVGFEVGPGTYSPFATSTVELPAVPLLAAAPGQGGMSWVGVTFLLVPVIAGVLIGWPAVRSLTTRRERVLSAGTAALATGVALAGLAIIAGGGVGDGRWSFMGSPAVLAGAVVTVEVGVIAVAVAALLGSRSVPWRAAVGSADLDVAVSPADEPGPEAADGTESDSDSDSDLDGAAGIDTDTADDPADEDAAERRERVADPDPDGGADVGADVEPDPHGEVDGAATDSDEQRDDAGTTTEPTVGNAREPDRS